MADVNYDFPIPTVAGQNITVPWLVADPRRIYRILNTLVQQFLIGPRVLAGRVNLTGSGAGIYELSEGIFADLQSTTVSPLSQYPLTTTTPGVLALVKPLKDGLRTLISDESIAHNRIDKVMRDLRKIANTLVFKNDGLILSVVASKVTQTQAVTNGAWTTANANPFLDAMLAKAQVIGQNKGYNADVCVLNFTGFAYVVSRAAVLNYMPRESANNIIATGNMAQLAGLTYWATNNLPAGISAMVLDSNMLGSIAYEELGGGYQGSANPDSGDAGVESKRWREEGIDGVNVQARLVQAPMVQEPNAGVVLTGTGV